MEAKSGRPEYKNEENLVTHDLDNLPSSNLQPSDLLNEPFHHESFPRREPCCMVFLYQLTAQHRTSNDLYHVGQNESSRQHSRFLQCAWKGRGIEDGTGHDRDQERGIQEWSRNREEETIGVGGYRAKDGQKAKKHGHAESERLGRQKAKENHTPTETQLTAPDETPPPFQLSQTRRQLVGNGVEAGVEQMVLGCRDVLRAVDANVKCRRSTSDLHSPRKGGREGIRRSA